jgi:hypothetical protein
VALVAAPALARADAHHTEPLGEDRHSTKIAVSDNSQVRASAPSANTTAQSATSAPSLPLSALDVVGVGAVALSIPAATYLLRRLSQPRG